MQQVLAILHVSSTAVYDPKDAEYHALNKEYLGT
jgi:hypothetical protein